MIAYPPVAALSPKAKARLTRIWGWLVRAPRVRELSRDAERRAHDLAVIRKEIDAMVRHGKRTRRRT